MPTPAFRVITTPKSEPGHPNTHMVMASDTGTPIGGFGAGYFRPWVFPLYTPSGRTVLQAYPFDHPFHNGIFVGQNPIEFDGGRANFWAVPPRRKADDAVFGHVGRMDRAAVPAIRSFERGVTFEQESVWRGERGEPVLNERRTVTLGRLRAVHVCDVTTHWSASYRDLHFPATKFGTLCTRIESLLLPPFGGRITADGGREGADAIHDQTARYVTFHNQVGEGAPHGILIGAPDQDTRDPWFVRAYGIVNRSPMAKEALSMPRGSHWNRSIRVVAFDGIFAESHAEDWLNAPLHLKEL